MLVLFQNKIIYMPNMPPFSRRERLEDHAKQCGGVQWREERVRSEDGVDLALAVGVLRQGTESETERNRNGEKRREVVVVHFHG